MNVSFLMKLILVLSRMKMEVHMIYVGFAIFYIGFVVLTDVTSRSEFFKNHCLKFGKKIHNFISFFSRKVL